MKSFAPFRTEEYPGKLQEKAILEAHYSSLQTKLRLSGKSSCKINEINPTGIYRTQKSWRAAPYQCHFEVGGQQCYVCHVMLIIVRSNKTMPYLHLRPSPVRAHGRQAHHRHQRRVGHGRCCRRREQGLCRPGTQQEQNVLAESSSVCVQSRHVRTVNSY